MSEGSLPPFKYLDPRRYPARLRDAAWRLLGRLRRGGRDGGSWNETADSGVPVESPVETPAGSPDVTTEPWGPGINPGAHGGPPVREPDRDEPALADRERAAAALRGFLEENATNVERAARTRAQAERLEREGTPSESARNRAERAREEVADGLIRLRRSLHSSGEPGAARALDLEVAKMDPPIPPAEIRR